MKLENARLTINVPDSEWLTAVESARADFRRPRQQTPEAWARGLFLSAAARRADNSARLENLPAITADEITTEAKRLAWAHRIGAWFEENPSAYGAKILQYGFSGRGMSAGMAREWSEACRFSEDADPEEVASMRAQAVENLSGNRRHLDRFS